MISNLERGILLTTMVNMALSRSSNYFKQYTLWNLVFIFYAILFDQCDEIISFLTINTLNIAIIFHTFFILQPSLLQTIPKVMNISLSMCLIKNIILHILPIYPLLDIYCSRKLSYVSHIRVYLIMYSSLWALIMMTHKLRLGDIYTLSSKFHLHIIALTATCHIMTPYGLWMLDC